MAQKNRSTLTTDTNTNLPDSSQIRISVLRTAMLDQNDSNFNILDDDTDTITEGDNKFVTAAEKAKITTNETAISTHTSDTDNPHSVDKTDVGLGNVDNTADTDKPISAATQLALDDKADLVGGLVPSSQLPAFVDDVEEYADLASFPATGESGKIYLALDTNKQYRWSGSAYVVLSEGVVLGETEQTAYRGDRGKIAYDHSQVNTGNPHSVTAENVGLGNVTNTSDANKPVSTAQQTALDLKADKSNVLEKDNTTAFTPTADNHPATKKYVDDAIIGAGGYNDEAAQNAVGGILANDGNVDFTYDDVTPKITATVDLSGKANASHTHTASEITDFDTEVSNNTDVAANTTNRHAHSNKSTLDNITDEGSGIIISAAERTKLSGIETGATADQTGAEIKAAYEGESNTNAFTDAEKTKLAGLEGSKFLGTYTSLSALQTAHASPAEGSYAHVDAGAASEVKVYIWDNDDSEYIEQAGASSAETAASIKTKYESNADTNAFNDASKTKVDYLTVTAAVNVDNLKTHSETTIGNPHNVTKSDVSLGNVTNDSQLKRSAGDINSFTTKATPTTSDLLIIEDAADSNNKKKVTAGTLPISTATQSALNTKLESSDIANFETSSQLNTRDTNNRNRANHTGTQLAATISNFDATVEENSEVKYEALGFAVSDETTELTVGTAKITFRMPFGMTLTAVRANVVTAPTGSTLIIDINESGTAILSTKLSIDATEKTSETATAAVISDSALADDAEITVDIDQVGATFGGAGLKIWLIGTRT